MKAYLGYAVLRDASTGVPESELQRPYCILRITVYPETHTTLHEEVERHESVNLARYWATMLNEGRESEESVRHKIADARETTLRRG